MGRLRNEQAGATYQVVARGVDRRRIFVDDDDYRTYTGLLGTVIVRQGWHLLCYCLMPNHVHLLIETPETNLGNGIQWLHGRYARAFNKRHDRVGHLFEAPYKSPIVTEETLVRTVGYIVANPMAASLCKGAADWPWGSHRAVAHDEPPEWLAHARLLEQLEDAAGFRCYGDLVTARELLCSEQIAVSRQQAAERRARNGDAPDARPASALSTTRVVL
jgi:REP element-mobilizing transposase RayT